METMILEHFMEYPKEVSLRSESGNLTMYPDAEEEIKIRAFKNAQFVMTNMYPNVQNVRYGT